MKPSIEVLERMGQIVVHVRHQYGRTPNDVEEQTLVLDEHSATELCFAISKVIKARRANEKPVPKEEPMRWYQIRSRASERRGPREAYGRGRDEHEAHQNSSFKHLHSGEITVVRMPEDFCPPNGGR